MRRRRFLLGTVVVLALATGQGTAVAAPAPVDGAFAGTGTVAATCPPPALLRIGTTASGDAATLGPFSLALDLCLEIAPGQSPAAGTFTITTGTGGLAGGVSGYVEVLNLTPQGFPFHYDLDVADGSGALAGTTGQLVLDGFYSPGVTTATGTVGGAVEVPPPPPTTPGTKADCKDAGWREVVDDQDRPFPNQGRCVAWVATEQARPHEPVSGARRPPRP